MLKRENEELIHKAAEDSFSITKITDPKGPDSVSDVPLSLFHGTLVIRV